MNTYIRLVLLLITCSIASACHKAQSVTPQPVVTPVTPTQPVIPVQPALPVPQVVFKNVVILGNSITLTPLSPDIGWNNTWGMAASVADSDYVHHLTVQFRKYYPDCKVTVRAFNEFEAYYPTYDFDAHLKDLKDSQPDLLIIRIGENMDKVHLDTAVFRQRYGALVNYFTASNPKLLILSGGPLWSVPQIDNVLQAFTPYVSLAAVSNDPTNFAFGLYADPGVQQHPGDKGMHLISDLMWAGIVKLKAK